MLLIRILSCVIQCVHKMQLSLLKEEMVGAPPSFIPYQMAGTVPQPVIHFLFMVSVPLHSANKTFSVVDEMDREMWSRM